MEALAPLAGSSAEGSSARSSHGSGASLIEVCLFIVPFRSARAALAVLLAGGLLSAAGCVSPCISLQRVICECQGQTQEDQRVCEDVVRSQEDLAPPDEAALERCENLLPDCQQLIADQGCEVLRRPEGKRACGMAEAEE